MTRLPLLSGQEITKAFQRMDYIIDHQTGSHIILRHAQPPYRRLTVPAHKEVAKGTLRALIRQAGLSVEQFMELLK